MAFERLHMILGSAIKHIEIANELRQKFLPSIVNMWGGLSRAAERTTLSDP